MSLKPPKKSDLDKSWISRSISLCYVNYIIESINCFYSNID